MPELCRSHLHPPVQAQWPELPVVTGSGPRQDSLKPVVRDTSLHPRKGYFPCRGGQGQLLPPRC